MKSQPFPRAIRIVALAWATAAVTLTGCATSQLFLIAGDEEEDEE